MQMTTRNGATFQDFFSVRGVNVLLKTPVYLKLYSLERQTKIPGDMTYYDDPFESKHSPIDRP